MSTVFAKFWFWIWSNIIFMKWLVFYDKRGMFVDLGLFDSSFLILAIFLFPDIFALNIFLFRGNIFRTIIFWPVNSNFMFLLDLWIGIGRISEHYLFTVVNVVQVVEIVTSNFPVSIDLLKFFVLLLIVSLEILLDLGIFFRRDIFVQFIFFVVSGRNVPVIITVCNLYFWILEIGNISKKSIFFAVSLQVVV